MKMTQAKDHQIEIFYSKEDEGWIAVIPELKFCSAFSKTPQGECPVGSKKEALSGFYEQRQQSGRSLSDVPEKCNSHSKTKTIKRGVMTDRQ